MNINPAQYGRTKDWPFHISSGGAVYKAVNSQRQYALLYRGPDDYNRDRPLNTSKMGSWHLPKGTLKHNETLEHCALREIKEESGLEVEIVAYLGGFQASWTSINNIDIDKLTHYFLCKWLAGDISTMDNEHDELHWFTSNEAIEKLSREPKREDQIIRRAEKFLASQ